MAKVSIKNDDGSIVNISIPSALQCPTSPANVISIGKLGRHYGEVNYDEDTCIKSTGNKSCFFCGTKVNTVDSFYIYLVDYRNW